MSWVKFKKMEEVVFVLIGVVLMKMFFFISLFEYFCESLFEFYSLLLLGEMNIEGYNF